MSEEIRLQFSPPEPLVDPLAKNSNAMEWVFRSTGRLKQLALDILSPNEGAIIEFTKFFVATVKSGKIVITRLTADDDIENNLASANLIMNIGALANDQPIVVELDIDPPINAGYSHVYTFKSRGPSDYIKVSVPLHKIEYALVNSTGQIDLLERHFSGQSPTLTPATRGVDQFITQSEINLILDKLKPRESNTIVKMVSGETQKTDLGNTGTDYALIIQGAGDVAKQETSKYTLEGRILLG